MTIDLNIQTRQLPCRGALCADSHERIGVLARNDGGYEPSAYPHFFLMGVERGIGLRRTCGAYPALDLETSGKRRALNFDTSSVWPALDLNLWVMRRLEVGDRRRADPVLDRKTVGKRRPLLVAFSALKPALGLILRVMRRLAMQVAHLQVPARDMESRGRRRHKMLSTLGAVPEIDLGNQGKRRIRTSRKPARGLQVGRRRIPFISLHRVNAAEGFNSLSDCNGSPQTQPPHPNAFGVSAVNVWPVGYPLTGWVASSSLGTTGHHVSGQRFAAAALTVKRRVSLGPLKPVASPAGSPRTLDGGQKVQFLPAVFTAPRLALHRN